MEKEKKNETICCFGNSIYTSMLYLRLKKKRDQRFVLYS